MRQRAYKSLLLTTFSTVATNSSIGNKGGAREGEPFPLLSLSRQKITGKAITCLDLKIYNTQLCCFQEKPQAAIFCLAPRQAVAEKDDKTSLYKTTFTTAECDIFILCVCVYLYSDI